MLDPIFLDRVARLTEVRIRERRRQFPGELTAIAGNLNARGLLRSSVHVFQSQQAHERELEARAILTWENLVRVHRTFGARYAPELRDDFKALLSTRVEVDFAELSGSFEAVQRLSGLLRANDLAEAKEHVLSKHAAEIDLYVDSLLPSEGSGSMSSPNSQTYNFYGNVGAVQTGAHAVANTIQNLGADDRAALISAIDQVKDALTSTSTLQEQHRRELLELASEAKEQLAAANPNNTKLLTVFTVLATSVQAIASAQPAYLALKSALLPLGIMLP